MNKKKKSSIGLTLNAHLPFVRHPEYPRFLEEDWLFESISETYLPLLRMLRKLREDEVPFRITISLSPTLCTMLVDPILQGRFTNYLRMQEELGKMELNRVALEAPELRPVVESYVARIRENLSDYFDEYQCNILSGFSDLEESGNVELITTAATHAFLPLYSEYSTAVNAQVELAVQTHVNFFKKRPKGFWLPECGYYPGLDEYLRKENISFFQLGAQALSLSETRPERGNYAPVITPSGVYAFARDYHLTNLIWSNVEGYPSDPVYREFYRDIGYDLPMEYIRPYIHEPQARAFTGFKYYAITGSQHKQYYSIEKAQRKVSEHASNFLYEVKRKTDRLRTLLDRRPFYTLAFDAELFGHWWHEGLDWLDTVIRQAAKTDDVGFNTPKDYIATYPEAQELTPAFSSWGEGGYANVWTDGQNVHAYRHVHKALERMEELAIRFPHQNSLKQRFLNQAAREVILSMASDWPFIMHNGTSSSYASRRLFDHVQNFSVVYEHMCKNAVNTEWLVKAEKRDIVFPDIDYNMFNKDSDRNRYNG